MRSPKAPKVPVPLTLSSAPDRTSDLNTQFHAAKSRSEGGLTRDACSSSNATPSGVAVALLLRAESDRLCQHRQRCGHGSARSVEPASEIVVSAVRLRPSPFEALVLPFFIATAAFTVPLMLRLIPWPCSRPHGSPCGPRCGSRDSARSSTLAASRGVRRRNPRGRGSLAARGRSGCPTRRSFRPRR